MMKNLHPAIYACFDEAIVFNLKRLFKFHHNIFFKKCLSFCEASPSLLLEVVKQL